MPLLPLLTSLISAFAFNYLSFLYFTLHVYILNNKFGAIINFMLWSWVENMSKLVSIQLELIALRGEPLAQSQEESELPMSELSS